MIKIPKSKQFQNDIEMFQFNIAENLLKVYKRPNIVFKMSISHQAAEYFKKKGLNCSRFKPCFLILEELKIKTVNKYSNDGFNSIEAESFCLKLIKPREKKLVGIDNTITSVNSNYQLSAKFIRIIEVRLNDDDLRALRDFASKD